MTSSVSPTSGQSPQSQSAQKAPSEYQGGYLAAGMGPIGIVLLCLYFFMVPAWSVSALLAVWPSAAADTAKSAVLQDSTAPAAATGRQSATTAPRLEPERATLFPRMQVNFHDRPEFRLLLIALLAGTLGSFIHACSSFVTYLGNRQLCRSWGIWYVFRPLIGMALATVFYFVIRGGLLPMQADAGNISPFGVAAGAGLVGMFAKEATDKLKEAFAVLFAPKEDGKRKDRLPEAAPQKPTDGTPPSTAGRTAASVAATHQHDEGA